MAETVKLLLNGEWVASEATETVPVYNPSDGTEIAATPLCDASEIDRVVQSASDAFPEWANTPAVDRARVMFRLVALMETHFEELAQLVTRENGKTIEDARGEIRRGIEVAEFACGAPALLMGDALENIAQGIDCDTIRQPLGVSVGITPFNFPSMVPMWTLPIAPRMRQHLCIKAIGARALERDPNWRIIGRSRITARRIQHRTRWKRRGKCPARPSRSENRLIRRVNTRSASCL